MKLPSLKPQEWSGQTYAWVGSGLFRIGVYPALKWTNYFGIQISRWKCTCFILIWLLAILWKYQVIWIDLNHAPLYDPSTYNFTHLNCYIYIYLYQPHKSSRIDSEVNRHLDPEKLQQADVVFFLGFTGPQLGRKTPNRGWRKPLVPKTKKGCPSQGGNPGGEW